MRRKWGFEGEILHETKFDNVPFYFGVAASLGTLEALEAIGNILPSSLALPPIMQFTTVIACLVAITSVAVHAAPTPATAIICHIINKKKICIETTISK
ncbi:hypothetical protein BDK51DRAFT_42580 [Blyttiomyces helicus]|uniref:Uncharacterized protein n=1 Tax=Blyttiomyces helicus TaxID=388810 RepID=A0A4P9W4H4_9FUNG|nr:hypothetical protein BDK51DRAFT_42580 [Blyttiomyces helicus]|eukprot:RKO86802.1 hypothetical protein BDK51DRAFT_42580 [Blyttiomyces helicus]